MSNLDARIEKIYKKIEPLRPCVTILYNGGLVRKVGLLTALDEIVNRGIDITKILAPSPMQEALNELLGIENGTGVVV